MPWKNNTGVPAFGDGGAIIYRNAMMPIVERHPKNRAKILCVDPEPRIPEWFPTALSEAGYQIETMQGSEVLRDPGRLANFDLAIVDLSTPEHRDLKLLRDLAAGPPNPPVVVLADHESMLRAEECIKAGASDCLFKPVSPVILEHVLERTLNQSSMQRELEYLRSQGSRSLLGKSIGIGAAWSRVLRQIERAAGTGAPLLLLGESGVGKGDAARLLHSLGPRSKRSFVRVDCAMLSGTLFASEDFTRRDKRSSNADTGDDLYFHVAHGGTLFLDEIGLLPGSTQDQVLRLLQEGSIEIDRESFSRYLDVRLVASSSIDLESEANAGRFRHDLLARIKENSIRIPPLRERVEDIPLLAAALLQKCASSLRKPVSSFHPDAMALLESYDWPGNVHELRIVIERAVLLADSSEIAPACLPMRTQNASFDANRPLNLRAVLAAEEKKTLVEALRRANGIRREAARLLGIDPRNLVYFLRKYGLDKREVRE